MKEAINASIQSAKRACELEFEAEQGGETSNPSCAERARAESSLKTLEELEEMGVEMMAITLETIAAAANEIHRVKGDSDAFGRGSAAMWACFVEEHCVDAAGEALQGTSGMLSSMDGFVSAL